MALIRTQTTNYRREQDKKEQITKQTRELIRLSAWPPNSLDMNIIEIIWSWMVKRIAKDGWPANPEELRAKVLEVWDDISLDSIFC